MVLMKLLLDVDMLVLVHLLLNTDMLMLVRLLLNFIVVDICALRLLLNICTMVTSF